MILRPISPIKYLVNNSLPILKEPEGSHFGRRAAFSKQVSSTCAGLPKFPSSKCDLAGQEIWEL